MFILKSISLFILAGICEIGGGYLIWTWLKDGKSFYYGIFGGLLLALYGVVATLQASDFARVYATYGGIFIALSFVWAWRFDGFSPNKYDVIGTIVAIIGVCIIYYSPRN